MLNIMNRYVLQFAVILFLMSGANVFASNDVEEVIVVGSKITNSYGDPEYDSSIIEVIDPTRVFQPGGLGGFVGSTLNGTDVKHTAVYKNGIPVNDSGSGWYDFGQDLPGWQDVKIVGGPNSVLYGSSSMAGTVLIEDTFDKYFFARGGENIGYVAGGNEIFQVHRYRGTSGSVKTDNDELDWFESSSVKLNTELGDWQMIAGSQHYEYDYDNCMKFVQLAMTMINDCTQKGKKNDFSLRGKGLTLGYSSNDVGFYTERDESWHAKSERYFADYNKEVLEGWILGIQSQREQYLGNEDDSASGYMNYNHSFDEFKAISFGYRYTEGENILRLGADLDGFRLAIANSYRKPNLYELNGDSWVQSNFDLLPEEGVGAEFGYEGLTVWYYEFSQGIDYDYTDNQYVNIGEYESQGVKFNDYIMTSNAGNFGIHLAYTDTDRIRIPMYKARLDYYNGNDKFDYTISYIGQWERGLDFDGTPIDDVSTVQINLGWWITNNYRLSFKIDDVFDKEFEILPGYGAGGRVFSLSLDLSL